MQILHHLQLALFKAHNPKSSKNPSPSQKLQQVFLEESLKLEAEEWVTHLRGNVYRIERQREEVQNTNPNPKILFNARGNPYVKGDPNLGYILEDIRPRNAPSHLTPKPAALSLTPRAGVRSQTSLS